MACVTPFQTLELAFSRVSLGGGRIKREGWERKPRPSCVHAATFHPWAQREMRTSYSPREGAVCSAQLSCGAICTPALGLWFTGWENACIEEKKFIFLGTSAPSECCSTDTTYPSCCLPTISLFLLLGIFNTHTRMSVSKLKCMTPFLIPKVCLHAHFELFS